MNRHPESFVKKKKMYTKKKVATRQKDDLPFAEALNRIQHCPSAGYPEYVMLAAHELFVDRNHPDGC